MLGGGRKGNKEADREARTLVISKNGGDNYWKLVGEKGGVERRIKARQKDSRGEIKLMIRMKFKREKRRED